MDALKLGGKTNAGGGGGACIASGASSPDDADDDNDDEEEESVARAVRDKAARAAAACRCNEASVSTSPVDASGAFRFGAIV
jgi:ABC-type branched-subunit amino acid transport system substrate-binding protein